MKRHLIWAALAISLLGAGCTFRPQIGMSFEDWNRECRSKTLSGGTLLEQKGSKSVYYCDDRNYLYTFENGGLASITEQPAYGPGDNFKLGR